MASAKTRAVLLLAKSALTGALGGLLFGFDTAVIAGTTDRVLFSSSPEFAQNPYAQPDAVLDIF